MRFLLILLLAFACEAEAFTIEFSDSKNISAPTASDIDFSPTSAVVERVVTTKVDDLTTEITYTDRQISLNASVMPDGMTATYESLDTDIATVSASGVLTMVTTSGYCDVLVKTPWLCKRINGLYVSNVQSDCYYETGSLSKNVSDWVDTRVTVDKVNAGNLSIKKAVYSTIDHTTQTYERNVDCWAYDADLTCMPVWVSDRIWKGDYNNETSYVVYDQVLYNNRFYRCILDSTGNLPTDGTYWALCDGSGSDEKAKYFSYKCCLITPQHVFSGHIKVYVGQTIRFLNNNNQIIERTITHIQDFSADSFSNLYNIGLLNAPIDPEIDGIKPAYVLPSLIDGGYSYLPKYTGVYLPYPSCPVPALCTDQENKAIVADVSFFGDFSDPSPNRDTFATSSPDNAQRLLLFESGVHGDSSSPHFLIINSKTVLVTCTNQIGAPNGPFIMWHIDSINAVLNGLGGVTGYTLTEVDLSGFTKYE